MRSLLLLAPLLAACSGSDADDSAAAPTVSFLDPVDGAVVTAGDVDVAVIVEGFALTDPAKHNEGEAEGYLAISVDGAQVLTTAETGFSVALEAGAHTLAAELFYADGDALEPPVVATIDVTAE